MDKINIYDKLNLFGEYWSPKILGEVNESYVKIAKLKGEFIWHIHENEDEMFFVLKGKFNMEYRDKTVEINENEFVIVSRGVEHRPVADEEVSVMLFEPKTILNTGDTCNEFTKERLQKI